METTVNAQRSVFGPAAAVPATPSLPQAVSKQIACPGLNAKVYAVPAGLGTKSRSMGHDNLTVLSVGSLLVESGEARIRYNAPAHFVISDHVPTTIHTLEPAIWYTVYAAEPNTTRWKTKSSSTVDATVNTRHHFSSGTYAKQMTLPKGHTALTHKHLYDHMSILAQGVVVVKTGDVTTTYTAPACIEISAGVQHSITAVETAEWFCIHATSQTDVTQVDHVTIGEN